MAGIGVTGDESWLEARCAGAPADLRERVRQFALGGVPAGTRAERLAGAARTALDRVLTQGQDRAVALDLLAADALITLALAAQAEADPAGLDRFAAELLGD
ncbi:MAG: hypothetical protein ACT4PM_08720 [Gemmatimonadales bacterium]